MDPIDTSSDDTEAEQVIDDRLEKVMQDFNEFRESMSHSGLCVPTSFEDLVDLYINNTGQNSYRTSQTQTTPDQLTALLEDFNKFETMLPSNQVESAHVQSKKGFNMYREMQESEIMIKEMAEDIDTGSGKRVTNIRYGELNCDGAASGIIASVFGGRGRKTVSGSLIRFLRNLKGVNESAKRRTSNEMVKKKSRDVTETDEEIAAGKAQANRQTPADLQNPASEAGKYQDREQRLKKRKRENTNYLQF